MTNRYSDTLRERAEARERAAAESWEPHKSLHIYGTAYGAALRDVANELDSPEFSGRIVYEQRNAALEDAKRWEAEASEWKRLCRGLAYQVFSDIAESDRSDALSACLDAVEEREPWPDDASQEDG